MPCRTFKVPATAPGENLKSRRNMMATTLHERLKAHGVIKLGARLSIINSLASPTLDELEAQLFKEAPPPSAEEPSSSIPFARFVVVHPSIHIRELPDVTSAKIGSLFAGDEVVVLREDGKWLELAEKNNRRETNGWVLRDGSSLGLGVLLRPLPPPSARDELVTLPPLTVRAMDGLCNRLRVVLSFARAAKQSNRPLLVWWPRSEVCLGLFTDAFLPLPDVTFVESFPAGVTPAFCPDSHDFHPRIKAAGEMACTECFRMLKLTEAAQRRVDDNLASLQPRFLSLHIRRTDHWGSHATDDDYIAFVKRYPQYENVFLATDNQVTQQKLLEDASVGPRLKGLKSITADPNHLRQTTLEDAAVDIFTASMANGPFKGCWSSSFSDTIHRLRILSGRVHPDEEHEITDANFQMGVTVHTAGGHKNHSPGMPMTSFKDVSERPTYAL